MSKKGSNASANRTIQWEGNPGDQFYESGVFVGTPEGDLNERRQLAQALHGLYAAITENLGKTGKYAEIGFAVQIVDGKLKICEASTKRTFKPAKE